MGVDPPHELGAGGVRLHRRQGRGQRGREGDGLAQVGQTRSVGVPVGGKRGKLAVEGGVGEVQACQQFSFWLETPSFRLRMPDKSAGSGFALARRVPGRAAWHESRPWTVTCQLHNY